MYLYLLFYNILGWSRRCWNAGSINTLICDPRHRLQAVCQQLNAYLCENAYKIIPAGEAEKVYASAVHALEDLDTILKYRTDLKIYVECCCIARDPDKTTSNWGLQIFQIFVKSSHAEQVLQYLVTTVLKLKVGARVLVGSSLECESYIARLLWCQDSWNI